LRDRNRGALVLLLEMGGRMKRIDCHNLVTFVFCLLIASLLLAGCGGTPTAAPPVFVPPNPGSGNLGNNGTYVNILIDSATFNGSVSNSGANGNLQLITVVSDDSGHADALICPYGGVVKVQQGDNINPCQAGLTYPDNLLRDHLYIMVIALDIKDSSTIADLGTNALSTGLGFGIQKVISAAAPDAVAAAGAWGIVGFLALDAVLGYAGNKVEEYFQKNYVIGTQSFELSRQYDWNNGQPISALSTNNQVRFTFVVQKSSTASGQIVGTAPSEPVPLNPTATEAIIPTSSNPAEEHLADPGEFARWYFTALWQDRNYDYLWTLSTSSFQSAASPGGYNEFTSWWGSVDKVDIGSLSVTQNDGHYASIHVVVTFHLRNGSVLQDRSYDYDLLFDTNRQTWMFDYR
jgi:hypothetical protein